VLAPGDVIGGDFEIEAPLGQGGMGAVYRARQRSTDALRAVKIMLPEWATSPELRERFEREARASGRIQSDHVVKIIAHGVDPVRQVPWLAMEYLTGATLEERMEQLGVPPNHTAFELLRQLFHGVAAAHAVGIVHRDLKPPNIHVSESYRADVPFTVKVLDFGIAKKVDAGGTSTRALGTRAWMAPEQADERGVVGPSADVWALGLIVFWLLTGRSFWKNADGSDVELLHEVHFAPVPTADERLGELGLPPLGAAFSGWLAQCLARDPSLRFHDAASAWSALAPVLQELPSESPWSRAFVDGRSLRELRASTPPSAVRSTAPAANAKTGRAAGLTPGPVARDRGTPLGRDKLLRWTAVSLGIAMAVVSAALWKLSGRTFGPGSGGLGALLRGHAEEPPPLPSAPVAIEAPPGMVYVPGGSFDMGSGDAEPDGPMHLVHLTEAFFIDVLEVTTKDYEACVAAGACTPSSVHGPGAPADATEYQLLCNRTKAGRGKHPVNCVDFEQARSFCIHDGKRLPTEAEWEYAARGADRRAYPWGNESPSTCDLAVTAACQATGTAPVGSRIAASVSAMGALDMAGNVGEWVQDSWDPAAYRAANATDPLVNNDSTFGVLRGGSWDLQPSLAITTSRQQFDKREGHVNTGFRCARAATR